MYKIEVKVKDELTNQTKAYNYDYCDSSTVDCVMHDMTKYIKRELKFNTLYKRISLQYHNLTSANITSRILFLTSEAADYLNREYGSMCDNRQGKISKFQGLPVAVVPDLEEDFYIGVNNG
jgi:hypothetical protein